MTIQASIEQKLSAAMTVSHLEVINESHQHNVPAGSESHFKVVVVAKDFEGQSLVKRHRLVYKVVAEEMQGAVHALALHTYTEAAWASRMGTAPDSPQCLGGKASEQT